MRERRRNLELFASINETDSKDFTSRTSRRDSPFLILYSKVTGHTQEAGWSVTPHLLLFGSVSFWQATLNAGVWE